MLQMSTVLLKADLDSASKVIDNSDALLLWYSVDLLRYCFLELRDGLRIVPVHIILQEPPQVEIWGVKIRGMEGPLRLAFSADEPVRKLVIQPVKSNISCVGRCPILLEPLYVSLAPCSFLYLDLAALELPRACSRLQCSALS